MAHQELGGTPLRVAELFAGVGGIRLALEGLGTPEHPKSDSFKVVWSSQWEPSTKVQHASDVYVARWGAEGHSNENVFDVVADPVKFAEVIVASPDVLVGGFPCQDYSVAKPADKATGIEGRKGVLWWAIYRALNQLQAAGKPVSYLILENVDRLLKSPTACRGRDFAIIVSSLAMLGYAVEWRVVNAADYGFPQRRRRVFMVAYHSSTELYQRAQVAAAASRSAAWLSAEGVIAGGLPATPLTEDHVESFFIGDDPLQAQAAYSAGAKGASRFHSGGLMVAGKVWTAEVKAARFTSGTEDTPDFARFTGCRQALTLGDVVAKTAAADVAPEFYLDDNSLARWMYLKGSKSAMRVAANGHEYKYSEGPLPFPDPLDRPARTIITGEGGSSASRTKHVVRGVDGRLRRLTSEELEELNQFPRGFTRAEGMSEVRRAFMMGNALVVGVVRAIGASLAGRHAGAC